MSVQRANGGGWSGGTNNRGEVAWGLGLTAGRRTNHFSALTAEKGVKDLAPRGVCMSQNCLSTPGSNFKRGSFGHAI